MAPPHSANPLKGEVALSVGGATYVLRYDIETLVRVENRVCAAFPNLGGIAAIIGAMHRTSRLGLIRPVLHEGLLAHHPDISELQAGEILGRLKVAPCLEAISAAFKSAFPEDGDHDDPEERGAAAQTAPADPQPPPPEPGTGSPS
jgi:hypothetical protein